MVITIGILIVIVYLCGYVQGRITRKGDGR
jgi:hypothetical protein